MIVNTYVVMVLACSAAYVAQAFSPLYRSIGATHSNTAHRLLNEPAANLPEYDETCIPGPRWHCPKNMEICSQTGITLSRFMMETSRINPELKEIESIFISLQTAVKAISNLVRTSSLKGNTGLEGGGGAINIQGEEQKKLDVMSNEVLKSALRWNGRLATIASEEEDAPVDAIMRDSRGNPVYSSDVVVDQEGRYVAVFDPLDGSSNIDAGIPVVSAQGSTAKCFVICWIVRIKLMFLHICGVLLILIPGDDIWNFREKR